MERRLWLSPTNDMSKFVRINIYYSNSLDLYVILIVSKRMRFDVISFICSSCRQLGYALHDRTGAGWVWILPMGRRDEDGGPASRRHPPRVSPASLVTAGGKVPRIQGHRLGSGWKELLQRVVASGGRRTGGADREGPAQDRMQPFLRRGRAGEPGFAEEGASGVREVEQSCGWVRILIVLLL